MKSSGRSVHCSPCRDCTARVLGCHQNCKEYRAWKLEDESLRAKFKQENDSAYITPETERQKRARVRKFARQKRGIHQCT